MESMIARDSRRTPISRICCPPCWKPFSITIPAPSRVAPDFFTISITELCKKVSLEKSQFYSCYQKFFQSTPHADLLQIRMDKAKNLLTNEALTVQQIAQMCGFSDFSHFSRYFRKQAGCSPLQWRRKMGEPH